MSTAPPSNSGDVGRWASSAQADAIATTGAKSTHGTTDDDGLRLNKVLKIP